jgi:hypothetical protein
MRSPDGINSLPSHLNEPLTHIRQILRACRAIRHVALDGCLCSTKAASSFGSNCQPLSLISINPYSFLGGFSAPMFRKLRRLEMCDTSMASEEVEQIRNLQGEQGTRSHVLQRLVLIQPFVCNRSLPLRLDFTSGLQ